jgi:hypothetical protein
MECTYHSCGSGLDRPLLSEDASSAELLAYWRNFCNGLKSICTSLASLTIIADCNSLQTAYEVTEPLNGLRVLQTCSIRLGQLPNHQLMRVAEATANNLTDRHPGTRFPFRRLPAELQEMILSYTDLVSPLYLACSQMGQDGRPPKSLRQLGDNNVLCCRRCSDTLDVCACPSRHAAYTTNNCTCWRFPSALFLVDRNLNALATRVFYSQNKFILIAGEVEDAFSPPTTDQYLRGQTALITSLPKSALPHLRWIEVSLKTLYPSDCLPGTSGQAAWTGLAAVIKSVARTTPLTVQLRLGDGVHDLFMNPEMDDAEVVQKWESFQNIADLFKATPTTGYRDFFIRLSSPQPHSAENDLLRWQRERVLEGRIMGAEYDAAARGKYRDPAEDFYQWNTYHEEPVYGPEGWLLNPVTREMMESIGPDESTGPRMYELRVGS